MKKRHNTAVWLNENITVELSKTKTANAVFLRFFALFLLLLTILYTAKMAIDMPFDTPMLIFSLLIAVGITLIYNIKEYRIYFILVLLIIMALGLVYIRGELLNGILIIRSNFMKAYNKYFFSNFLTYDVTIPVLKEYLAAKSSIMTAICCIISLCFGYLLKKGTATIPALILLLPMFWVIVNFGDDSNAQLIMLAFFTILSIYALENRTKSGRKIKGDFFHKFKAKKTEYICSAGNIREKAVTKGVVSTLCLAAIIIGMVMVIFPQNTYDAPQKIKEISQDPMAFVSNLRNKFNFDGIVIKGMNGFSPQSGIGAGELKQIDRPIADGTKTHLKIKAVDSNKEFSEFGLKSMPILKPMLLKGYVGSVYTGTSWEDLPVEVYNENSKLFSDFTSEMIPPPYLFTEMINLIYENSYTSEDNLESNGEVWLKIAGKKLTGNINKRFPSNLVNFNVLEIENVNANKKFAYAPYSFANLLEDDNVTSIFPESYDYDRNIDTGDISDKYKMLTAMTFDSKEEQGYKNFNSFESMQGYTDNETFKQYSGEKITTLYNAYSDFAYTHYLQMPEDRLEEIKEYFVPYASKSEIDYEVAIMLVKDYLTKHAVYDLSPGKIPEGKDYIEYFLYENHRGYCSNFATAATMMFRSLGIPARYVEGYTLTQEDIDYKKDAKGNTIISDTNAHAWTEIFIDNIGFVPVDVTPGFSGERVAEQVSNPPVPEEITNSQPAVSSQPISESKPQVSSSVTQLNPINVSSTPEVEVSEQISKITTILLYLLLTLLIIISAILLMHSILIRLRNKLINQEDKNQAVIEIYKQMEKIIRFIGYQKQPAENEADFAARMTAKCSYINDEGFIELTVHAQKAYYSKHKIEAAEWEKSKEYLISFSQKVYLDQGRIKKLIYWLTVKLYTA